MSASSKAPKTSVGPVNAGTSDHPQQWWYKIFSGQARKNTGPLSKDASRGLCYVETEPLYLCLQPPTKSFARTYTVPITFAPSIHEVSPSYLHHPPRVRTLSFARTQIIHYTHPNRPSRVRLQFIAHALNFSRTQTTVECTKRHVSGRA